jgi:Phosphatidylinositol-specific phospholipase C, X domain
MNHFRLFVVFNIFCISCDARRVCNGLSSNCSKRVNEIMFATVHNAMSSLEDGFIAYNNLKSLEKALKAGYRGLFLDSCDCNSDGINFCHSFCFAGKRKSLTVFNSIVKFMKENPNEVLVIELQINDDSLSELWEIAPSAFKNYLYSHPGRNKQWPTLNTMINSGKRIIVFQHNGPNCDKPGACPNGVHK